ncbi:hypothetical protein IL306_012001 [Fusarium sp. DS 682]|nr:hypothetical protein IL306_012001 [Fusarium sp. DS 682]
MTETPSIEMDATVRVGMFKAIKEMIFLTGEKNATILSMWFNHCKVWEPPMFFNQGEYMSKLEVLRAALDRDLAQEQQGVPCEFNPESQVAIAYDYAYRVYYVCKAPDALEHVRQVKDLAVKLPCLTSTNP